MPHSFHPAMVEGSPENNDRAGCESKGIGTQPILEWKQRLTSGACLTVLKPNDELHAPFKAQYASVHSALIHDERDLRGPGTKIPERDSARPLLRT